MNMFKPKKQIKSTNFFKPKKNFGQNFLKSDKIAADIVASAEITPDDTIIEIGPGTGILTEQLVKTGATVFAIEKDFDLIKTLKRNIGEPKNLKVIHQDALWFDLDTIKPPYKVVANIPYQITSPLIRKFIEGENKPEVIVMMVQKEVAERITAKPGNSSRGLLTIIVEYYARPEILFGVSKKEFYPVPKVDSAVIKLKTKILDVKTKDVNENAFFKIVKAGFSSKRQQIHNSLAATMRMEKAETLGILNEAGIEPTLRAEDLTLENWIVLTRVIVKKQNN